MDNMLILNDFQQGTIGDHMSIRPFRPVLNKLTNHSAQRISKRSTQNFDGIFEKNPHIVIKKEKKRNFSDCAGE